MLDATYGFGQQLERDDKLLTYGRAQLFVDTEYTAKGLETRKIALQLLEEIGLLEDAARFQTTDQRPTGVTKRGAAQVEKKICFMASFLRVVSKVDLFGILMDRRYWTGKPCGYKAARETTKALFEHGYIEKTVKFRKGQSTVYRCSDALRDRVTQWKDLLTFKRARQDPVEVREAKGDWHWTSPTKKVLPLKGFPEDNVRRHEEMVRQINDHLSGYVLADAGDRPIDTSLRRIFGGDLHNGGRLYGHYQTMPEAERLRCTIDSEPVCEIDLKASHVALLAAIYRHPERLPRDPYAAIEWVDTKLRRKAAKILVQSIIHKPGYRPRSFPRTRSGTPFRDQYGLEDKKIADLIPGIFVVLPFLDGSPSLTMHLQFIEAEILMEVLLRLRGLGIAALPVHDSLLVKRSDEATVLRALQETQRDHLGPHAPWLDISTAGGAPRLVEPLPCPDDAGYRLRDMLDEIDAHVPGLKRSVLEYAEQSDVEEEDDMLIDPDDTGDC